MLNALLFDSLLDAPDTLPRFFAEFGELEGTAGERRSVCLFVEFWVQWILQLPFLGLFLEFHKSGRTPQFVLRGLRFAVSLAFRLYSRGIALRGRNRSDFWSVLKAEFLHKTIDSSTIPAVSLLLCEFLAGDLRRKGREAECVRLLHQIRSVTVLSMAVK